jgi:hypothetical protein
MVFQTFFQSLGPNSGLGNGSLLIVIEAILLYVVGLVQLGESELLPMAQAHSTPVPRLWTTKHHSLGEPPAA